MAGSAASRARWENDHALTTALLAALGPLDLVGLQVVAREGVAYLEGSVPSGRQRRQAEEIARGVPGIRDVVNELVVEPTALAELPRESDVEPIGVTDYEEGVEVGPGTEPDLNLSIGTNDPAEATDGDEPYYPPTDPVVRPLPRSGGDIRVLGGFARGAMDAPPDAEDVPARLRLGDDEIADQVRLALEEDAATTDLDVRVIVRRGVVILRGRVGSLEDAESAEEVASRVRGVREVREELDVEGV